MRIILRAKRVITNKSTDELNKQKQHKRNPEQNRRTIRTKKNLKVFPQEAQKQLKVAN